MKNLQFLLNLIPPTKNNSAQLYLISHYDTNIAKVPSNC